MAWRESLDLLIIPIELRRVRYTLLVSRYVTDSAASAAHIMIHLLTYPCTRTHTQLSDS